MPSGWRPSDVVEKYPISKIEDVYHFAKYQPLASNALKGYSIFQLLCNTGLMLFMFYNYTEVGFNNLLLYGAFVFVGIYGYTTLMDRRDYAIWVELFRGIAGILLIVLSGDWFGINLHISWGSYLVGRYFLITALAAGYFTFFETKIGAQPA